MIASDTVEPSSAAKGLAQARSRLSDTRLVQNRGRVTQMIGLVIESQGPWHRLAKSAASNRKLPSKASGRGGGFSGSQITAHAARRSERHLSGQRGDCHRPFPGVPVGDQLLGRVINGLGQPLDELGELSRRAVAELDLVTPHPLKRARIRPFVTGIKAIDTFTPLGRGQRMGIFAGSGVGKSTLMGMMASQAEADVNVIALIGERGREVRDFIERDLDEEGRRKSVIIVATSNEPALARVKGTFWP